MNPKHPAGPTIVRYGQRWKRLIGGFYFNFEECKRRYIVYPTENISSPPSIYDYVQSQHSRLGMCSTWSDFHRVPPKRKQPLFLILVISSEWVYHLHMYNKKHKWIFITLTDLKQYHKWSWPIDHNTLVWNKDHVYQLINLLQHFLQ